ncbi:MAG: TIM barrel protein [Planctomycetaceae bacterium]
MTGDGRVSRREVLRVAGAGAALGAAVSTVTDEAAAAKTVVKRKRRIRQSIVHWCFKSAWSTEEMCVIAKKLGCPSIELCPTSDWPTLKKHGLTCAIAGIDMGAGPPFVRGFNNPKFHDQVIEATRKSIDASAEFGTPCVISFTGFSAIDPDDKQSAHISRDDGIRNCVAGYKKIVAYAEKRKVTLALEMLNTRDDTHPMKGHPGYQGDRTDYVMEIINRVGSPSLKLLFDIYHVQIMDGDVIRRIGKLKDAIAHVHTAGNPGRGELDDRQEINYPPIMRALLAAGYKGYVGQEFIPTGDPWKGLKQAVALCDV